MIKKSIFGIFFLFLFKLTYAQSNSISLDSCVVWAKKHYPLMRQNALIDEASAVSIKAINENWLPKLSFLGQGVYQTEVVAFNIPGINTNFPHDSYLTQVALEQTLFEGGQVRQQKNIEHLSSQIDVQKNEIELYKLIERVNQLYVNILLVRENNEMLTIYKTNLENRRKNSSSAETNGLALQSNLDELDAELMKTDQSLIESKDNLTALYTTLSMYIDKPVSDATVLTLIPIGGNVNTSAPVLRPETKLFSLQEELIDSRYKLTNRLALPKVSIGLAANYGRPGPNFINQNLRFFGSANLTIRWNISSLYGLNREKTRYEINKEMVNVQKEAFLFSIETALTSQQAQLNSMKTIIEKDNSIIEKRHNVSIVAASQLDNGKITVTNYVTQLNEEMAAKLNKKIHEIKLMNAQSSYNTTKGITNY
jgi:outer membrane protein TolC